jgi:Type II secretory pathway, component ExeA (predicted ATPase)
MKKAPEVREVVQRCELVELPPLDTQLEAYLGFKFERVGKPLDEVFDKGALDGIRARLIFTKSGKTRESVSLMYPLMINNLVTAALNMAATLGLPKINNDLIMES